MKSSIIYIIYLYSPFIDDHFIIDRSYTLVLTFVNRYEVSNLCTHTHRMQSKFEILFFLFPYMQDPKHDNRMFLYYFISVTLYFISLYLIVSTINVYKSVSNLLLFNSSIVYCFVYSSNSIVQ